jgi:MFS family permease
MLNVDSTAYFLGAFLGPVMAGNIGGHHGWRSFFWLETGLAGFAVIMIFFTFPETKWHRRDSVSAGSTTPSVIEQSSPTGTPDISDPEKQSIPTTSSPSPSLTRIPGRPSRSSFHPTQLPDPRWKSFILRDVFTPLKLFLNPIVLWAGLMLAGPADLVLFYNMTESPVLSAPPYHLSPAQVGYTNFAFVFGALIGLLTAGPLSDFIAARAARKNAGVREAEMRLPTLLPYMIITILSSVLGAFAYQRSWPLPHIIVWGYGLAGLSVTSVPTIAIAYAVDCYKPVSGEIMVVATVCKNFIGFTYSYWVFDLARDGWVVPAMVIFACVVAPAVGAVPLYWGGGKRVRVWTRGSGVHCMEEIR